MKINSLRSLAPAMLSILLLTGCVSEQRYDALQGAYTQLQARYTADEATIQMLNGRLKITMTDRILFSSGGYRINERAREALGKMVPTLQGLQNTRVIVEGYTDTTPVGPELRREGISTNLDLSSRRADTVADSLIAQGTPRNIISADGRGEANPIAPNTTAEGRAQNRRIEITLVGPGN
ncbi:OmpA family protein [Sediminicoccus sp. KRV36]|uniref:OmpA/MotB family protein n=1 Tax=Sediminicoccus sp. KRV36 TaxID=3133721 RepID=UPI0020107FDB|nr:OmpA family protein [Sediminicoccus rosea]UPY35860.1 OmpA family protein [Sediminicoccus rosea]